MIETRMMRIWRIKADFEQVLTQKSALIRIIRQIRFSIIHSWQLQNSMLPLHTIRTRKLTTFDFESPREYPPF